MMTHWLKAAAGGLVFLAAAGMAADPAFAFGPFQFRPIWAPPAGQSYDTSQFGMPTYGRRIYRQPAVRAQQNSYHIDRMFQRQTVSFPTRERAGTIIVDTGHKFLFLVLGGGEAIRYGIGTARDGFEWGGVHKITNKREWPDWTPPAEMIKRQPGIPHHMAGGPNNPLGARALYIGSTLYRIHGTNEPWTIGGDVSSGCIRMINEDVIDLYSRAKIGAKVIVL
jgi:lipoprotein-anchoring transpeptidase ErfK/SrfK